jgi:hypothetical protein
MNTTKRSKKNELYKLMTPELRKQAVLKTKYSYQYINSILNPNNERYNEQVVQVCEELIAAQNEAFSKINITINRLK